MQSYLNLIDHILTTGKLRSDRTGVGTIGVFGYQMRFDLRSNFPAVTTKKLAWKSVVSELLWFLEGSTDERRLAEILYGTRDASKSTIWTANVEAWKSHARFDGDAGRIYGSQWRDWSGKIDQIDNLIKTIQTNPFSRRHLVVAFNPAEIDSQSLPACHSFFQMYVDDNELSCHLYMRSGDVILGTPFNVASYALLTNMIAQQCNLVPGELIVSYGDAHIYQDHIEAAKMQLKRLPFQSPTLQLNKAASIFDYKIGDCQLQNYQYHPSIQLNMAV